MAADIRLGSITIEPSPRSSLDSVTMWAECQNYGDQPTGEFVARFELDQSLWFEVPVNNIAPGQTGWAAWPHGTLDEGSHVVRCILDVRGQVDEPEERHNQKTQHFDVGPVEYPPQAADGDEYFDETALINAVINRVQTRVALWLGFAVQAVEEWESDANQRVRDFEWDGDAEVDFGTVLWSFASTVVSYIPGAKVALGVVEDGGDLLGMLQRNFGTAYLGESGAKRRLERAVADLKVAAGATLREAVEGSEARISARLDPNSADNPLTWVESGSNDPSYVDSICDWLGVEEPTGANTAAPIKQELTAGFERVLAEVTTQLLREEGYGD